MLRRIAPIHPLVRSMAYELGGGRSMDPTSVLDLGQRRGATRININSHRLVSGD